MVHKAIENQVVTLPALREILLRIINHLIRAHGPDHFHIPRAAHASHIRAQRLGDLHCEGTHASGRTIDQDLLPRLNVSLVPKTLQCRECRDRRGSRLLKRQVLRLDGQSRLRSTHVLGEGTFTYTEHFVAWLELRYLPANCFHLSGHINAGSFEPWLAQAEQYAKAVWHTFHQACIQWIDGSRASFYQNFIVPGNGPLDVLDLNNDVRRSVSRVDGGFHRDGTTTTRLIRPRYLPANIYAEAAQKSHFLCREA